MQQQQHILSLRRLGTNITFDAKAFSCVVDFKLFGLNFYPANKDFHS